MSTSPTQLSECPPEFIPAGRGSLAAISGFVPRPIPIPQILHPWPPPQIYLAPPFLICWLILGIYNLQGLDVAGLLSGPQPSSSTLPNLSCPHWLCVPPVSLDAAPLTWLDLCHAHRGQSSTSPGTVHAGSPVLLCLLPALYVVAVARAPSS